MGVFIKGRAAKAPHKDTKWVQDKARPNLDQRCVGTVGTIAAVGSSGCWGFDNLQMPIKPVSRSLVDLYYYNACLTELVLNYLEVANPRIRLSLSLGKGKGRDQKMACCVERTPRYAKGLSQHFFKQLQMAALVKTRIK